MADLVVADPEPIAHAKRRASIGDAHHATSSKPDTIAAAVGPNDPDTCRICRGEATSDEPLFYPCKCSGSIKYVHQDCLMEWLSHSQKKHCELCKTPFRFTKLYASNMPANLPSVVIVKHIWKYLLSNIVLWCRAALVSLVWLGCLPYLMRAAWSFLFWISDEGLGAPVFVRRSVGSDLVTIEGRGTTGCAANHLLLPSGTSSAAVGMPGSGNPNVHGSPTDSRFRALLQLLVDALSFEKTVLPIPHPISGHVILTSTSLPSPPAQATVLGQYPILANLTRYTTVNQMVVSVLEGQAITIIVIVCFILIILVRDYVVQQRPEINMRAAFAAAENPVPQPVVPLDDDVIMVDAPPLEPEDLPTFDVPDEGQADIYDLPPEPDREHTEDGAQPEVTERADRWDHDWEPRDTLRTTERAPRGELEDDIVFSGGADIEPETNGLSDAESPAAHDYSRIFREAGGDPDKILRIVKEEGLEAKLDYWIQRTQAKIGRNRHGADMESPPDSINGESLEAPRASHRDPPEVSEDDLPTSSKGKGKAEEDSEIFMGTPLRPRANTDGPQPGHGVHPFANNNWQLPSGPPPPPSRPTGPANVTELAVLSAAGQEALRQSNPNSDGSTDRQSSIFPTPPSDFDLFWEDGSEGGSRHGRASYSRGIGGTDESDNQTPNHEFELEETQEGPAIDTQASADWDGPPIVDGAAPPNQGLANDQRRVAPAGVFGQLAQFMWQDVDRIPPDELVIPPAEFFDDDEDMEADEEVPRNLAEEAERDREVMEAAAAAGLDPEAIEDAEDLEGVMELLGMRGPWFGLFQNAVFCGCLVSITIFLGIFLPYNIGRISVWAVAKPMRVVQMFFSLIKFVQDLVLVGAGVISWLLFRTWGITLQVVALVSGWDLSQDYITAMSKTTWDSATSASWRIFKSFTTDFAGIGFSPVEIKTFSAVSHEALLTVKDQLYSLLVGIGDVLAFIFGGSIIPKALLAVSFLGHTRGLIWHGLCAAPRYLLNPASWVINLEPADAPLSVDHSLAYWSANDRVWAISFGYLALFAIAALYLRRGTPLFSTQVGQEWEASIIDGLNQASGVMKVILIIGIEMLVFPLYCGLLLDIALLPLFDRTTLQSRVLFTVNNPFTSTFVHWFVGTGYMFHFALFVSMCRKIMRKGVLYFIRDPDDPDFHPVRDVLERNVTSQLRKILFSAFVYGALVMICLGGVVWGLALAVSDVLPIHYSSNEPVLEFPIDLLFYNFLMPLAVKFFRPSDGLHAMYTWWFRKCARVLRVTWFLFGERRLDEEGTIMLAPDSPHLELPWWRRFFLEYNSEGHVVPKTWKDTFEGGTAKPTSVIPQEDMFVLRVKKQLLVERGELVKDGRFVRTPASDQVKIPKGWKVFLGVSETNSRTDGKDDNEADLYSGDQYQLVYLPPNFRLRVSLFILLIWIFAAVTGVGITIVPLLFGRRMFKLLIPAHVRTNDIYAFSIGIYILGSVVYTILHARAIYNKTKVFLGNALNSLARRDVAHKAASYLALGVRLVYTYFALLVVFPLLASALVEVYLLMPMHTYMYPMSPLGPVQPPRHTVRVIQSWTLGLLYLKVAARAVTVWYPHTRFGTSVRAVLRRGFLDPDVSILTRAFVIPGLLVAGTALLGPVLTAHIALSRGWLDSTLGATPTPTDLTMVYRSAYPAATFVACVSYALWSIMATYNSWKLRIKDEAYLIGERLHNLGAVTAGTKNAWRAGGDRL